MAAILPTLALDQDEKTSRFFIPYQLNWIQDDSRMRLAEKSVRIGWTWADAFKNVRKRLQHKERDYLFATKDQLSAVEYVQTCEKFCEIYDITKTILSRGVEYMKVPIFAEGKDTGFTEDVKVGYIKFDNGSRILAFSSNPNAMRVFGGDVGLDEFAYHPAPQLLWETAQGRITWGYDIGVWSSHTHPLPNDMSLQMTIKLREPAARIVKELETFPERMSQRIAGAMDRRNQLVVGYIQKEKLTRANPPYLNVRTGRMRGSVRATRAAVSGRVIRSSIGTNVRYAGVHEYGFKGTVQVGAFEREIPANRFGKGGKGGGTEKVKAHSRRVNFKARHMFQDGIEDNLANYTDDISAAITEAWGK